MQELSDFISEKKGANVVNGIVATISSIVCGAVMLGFLFTIGVELVGSPWNETLASLQTKSGLILSACVLIPLALLIGTVTALIS